MNMTAKTTVVLCGPPVSALGGGPTHIRNLLNSPLTNRFHLVHFEAGSRGIESPAKDESLFAMVARLAASPWALAWCIWRSRPAVVHINSAMDNKAFWRDCIYLAVCKLFRCPVVFQLHGGLLHSICTNKVARRLVRTLFGLADAVVLLATVERRDFENLGITGRLVVIPNGVDIRDYDSAATRVHSGRVRRLVYLGRLIREKGVFEAVEAVDVLRKDESFRDIELNIAGTGPALSELQSYVSSRSLNGYVKLLGSVVGPSKIRLLQDADVFVFPTYHQEGLPYAILESLAAGTPVITSRAGGIPDVVVDGVHGLFAEPRDPGSIIGAIRQLSGSNDRLRDMSRHCREWARDKLGLERLAMQFAALYDDVIGKSGPPLIVTPEDADTDKRINTPRAW